MDDAAYVLSCQTNSINLACLGLFVMTGRTAVTVDHILMKTWEFCKMTAGRLDLGIYTHVLKYNTNLFNATL